MLFATQYNSKKINKDKLNNAGWPLLFDIDNTYTASSLSFAKPTESGDNHLYTIPLKFSTTQIPNSVPPLTPISSSYITYTSNNITNPSGSISVSSGISLDTYDGSFFSTYNVSYNLKFNDCDLTYKYTYTKYNVNGELSRISYTTTVTPKPITYIKFNTSTIYGTSSDPITIKGDNDKISITRNNKNVTICHNDVSSSYSYLTYTYTANTSGTNIDYFNAIHSIVTDNSGHVTSVTPIPIREGTGIKLVAKYYPEMSSLSTPIDYTLESLYIKHDSVTYSRNLKNGVDGLITNIGFDGNGHVTSYTFTSGIVNTNGTPTSNATYGRNVRDIKILNENNWNHKNFTLDDNTLYLII